MKVWEKMLAQEEEERNTKNALPSTPGTPQEAHLEINPNLTLCRFFNIGYSIFLFFWPSIFFRFHESSKDSRCAFAFLDRTHKRTWHFFGIGYYQNLQKVAPGSLFQSALGVPGECINLQKSFNFNVQNRLFFARAHEFLQKRKLAPNRTAPY